MTVSELEEIFGVAAGKLSHWYVKALDESKNRDMFRMPTLDRIGVRALTCSVLVSSISHVISVKSIPSRINAKMDLTGYWSGRISITVIVSCKLIKFITPDEGNIELILGPEYSRVSCLVLSPTYSSGKTDLMSPKETKALQSPHGDGGEAKLTS